MKKYITHDKWMKMRQFVSATMRMDPHLVIAKQLKAEGFSNSAAEKLLNEIDELTFDDVYAILRIFKE